MNAMKAHESWRSVMSILNYDEDLMDLKENVLPNISYQPSSENVFNVFSMPVKDVKVVILGTEPSYLPGDSTGYAFASNTKMSKSLQVIKSELIHEGMDGGYSNQKGWKTLEHWTEQGVFLLNTSLTVDTGTPHTHTKHWNNFIKNVVHFIAQEQPCIWVLWGKKAQSYLPYINNNPFHVLGYDVNTINHIPANTDYNYILRADYPLSELEGGKGGFYGCNHFLFINKILSLNKKRSLIY